MDGCVTNDGDAFLYGARTVYKNLSIDKKVGALMKVLYFEILETVCFTSISTEISLRQKYQISAMLTKGEKTRSVTYSTDLGLG